MRKGAAILCVSVTLLAAVSAFSSRANALTWIEAGQEDFQTSTLDGVVVSQGNVTLDYDWDNSRPIPVLKSGGPGEWDQLRATPSSVVYRNGRYMMWFNGGNETPPIGEAIGLATSMDGINWVKSGSNPVLESMAGTWQDRVIGPSVLWADGLYHMWYTGIDIALGAYGDPIMRIGYANSSDGISWNRFSTWVLEPDPSTWDELHVAYPFVKFNGDLYQMWYQGYSWGPGIQIGLANSTDGLHWVEYAANPVLSNTRPSGWEEHVRSPSVIDHGNRLFMYYSGHGNTGGEVVSKVGLATSIDGAIWTRYPSNPVLNNSVNSFDSGAIMDRGVVLKDAVKGMYTMWFGGTKGEYGTCSSSTPCQTGLAISSDGINWTKFAGYRSSGTLQSSVFDSGHSGTTWTNISWMGVVPPGTQLTISTRTGGSAVPDASWSAWSLESSESSGTAIQSPPGRYVQYRATLTSTNLETTSVLKGVSINYEPSDENPPTGSLSAFVWVVLAILLVAIVIALAVFMRRKSVVESEPSKVDTTSQPPSGPPVLDETTRQTEPPSDEKLTMLEKAHSEGRISDDVYREIKERHSRRGP